MSINPMQMQKGLALSEFLRDYGTEEQCKAAVYRARWPNGFICPVCNDARATQFMRGRTRYWQCCACAHQTTLVAGTMMQHTRLPLMKWFLAMYLVTQSKTNIAALALRRQVGVSWKTAWLLKHKLMDTMRQAEEGKPLCGDIRVDDAYLGGERNGGKPGRGSENKTAFVVSVEMKEDRPQRVRFDVVAGFSFQALRPWARRALVPGSDIISDGLIGFEIVRQYGCSHQVVISPKGKAGTEVNAFKWLNVILGNLKTALLGTHHAFKFSKYAPRYLAEVQYRFNRRFDLTLMIPSLVNMVATARPCPYGRILPLTE